MLKIINFKAHLNILFLMLSKEFFNIGYQPKKAKNKNAHSLSGTINILNKEIAKKRTKADLLLNSHAIGINKQPLSAGARYEESGKILPNSINVRLSAPKTPLRAIFLLFNLFLFI